jgi:dTDP-4-amino-4,6-dideoxygalactose transaminase
MVDFGAVSEFEKRLAKFFNAPYAVATDSCTHGLELALRYTGSKKITVPIRTYVSVPFLANKLNIELEWSGEEWENFYYITNKVIDAAVLWRAGSYIPGTFMCLSFQFKKHLNLGRGGAILTDNKNAALKLKKMSYDGRLPNVPWREQDIKIMGYHYYMTPETAELGLNKLQDAIDTPAKQWVYTDWPDVSAMSVFKN